MINFNYRIKNDNDNVSVVLAKITNIEAFDEWAKEAKEIIRERYGRHYLWVVDAEGSQNYRKNKRRVQIYLPKESAENIEKLLLFPIKQLFIEKRKKKKEKKEKKKEKGK